MTRDRDQITDGDIEQALQKLKSQVYYDKSNTNLYLRKELTKYLHENGKEKLIKSVKNILRRKKKFNPLLKRISYAVIPKSIKQDNESKQYITNFKSEKNTVVKDINLIINAPLEIHILSILWLMRIGYKIDNGLSNACYGNRLLLKDDRSGLVSGRGLLKPYYRQYQKWRDKGIEAAKGELKKGHNSIFVNLDITGYYYNVRLNWEELEEFVADSNGEDKIIHNLLLRVHQDYTKKVLEHAPWKSFCSKFEEEKVMLPIGLFSSYTLANFYLQEFDEDVAKLLNASYYGRYVDDIVFVISNTQTSEIDSERLKSLINEHGHDKRLTNHPDEIDENSRIIIKNFSELFKVEFDEEVKVQSDKKEKEQPDKKETVVEYRFQNKKYDLLRMQQKKVMFYKFIAGYSSSVIDKLQKDIEERSSEFRRLPTLQGLDFEKEVYELLYDDSFGKPRTLKDYKENRVGLSTYLYKATSLAIWKDGKTLTEEIKKVLAFFKGSNLIKYYQYWERLFTLLVIANRKQDLIYLLQDIAGEIENLKLENGLHELKKESDEIENSEAEFCKPKENLREYVCVSLAQAFALKADILKDSWFQNKLKNIFEEESNWAKNLSDYTLSIRNMGFVRSAYVTYPLMEFTNWAKSEKIDTIESLVEPELDWAGLTKSNFELSGESKSYPRFFNLYEVSHYLWLSYIVNSQEKESFKTKCFTHKFIGDAIEKFKDLNELPTKNPEMEEAIQVLSKKISKKPIENAENLQEIHIQDHIPDDFDTNGEESLKIRIGIANMEVKWESEAAYSLRARPLATLKRLNRVSEILEKFRTSKPNVDLAVFPEVSIPHAFTSGILWFVKNHQLGLVFGMEHLNTGKVAYNFIATVLPFKLSKRQDAIFIPRLKNHYGHHELAMIKANGVVSAENSNAFYHLFKWRELYFTTFYCFELADVVHRSWFRSKVDLLVASEYNKDVNYFSNIVDSTARDLNVYVVQVNSSGYGDNRLTRPTKTIHKNLIRLDGGENDLVITATIDLKEFREHSEVGFDIQRDAKVYKPSPPHFDIEKVKRRIRGEWVLEGEYEDNQNEDELEYKTKKSE